MLNTNASKAVEQSKFGKHFLKPLYNSYCFSNIPQTVKNILTKEHKPALPDDVFPNKKKDYQKVILFFIDSFGWRFFHKYHKKYPFLKRMVQQGVASKITSQFPSTTPAHVTTIHTGVPVGMSGIYEWIYYEPKLDLMVSPLLYTYSKYAGVNKKRNLLLNENIKPSDILPTQTVYKDLKKSGVSSFVFQHSEYSTSPYNETVCAGAKIYPYMTLAQGLTNMTQLLLKKTEQKEYYFLYFDKVDVMCHKYGPNSPQLEAEIDSCFTQLERLFYKKIKGHLKNTIFMMTADHGQSEIDPETAIYLNIQFKGVEKYFKRTKKNEIMVPAGASRDMFLYIKNEYIEEAYAFFKTQFEGTCEVYKTSDLIQKGFFGKTSSTFKQKIADLVILPYRGNSVWWYEKGVSEQNKFGHHGGLTPQELETIFLTLNI